MRFLPGSRAQSVQIGAVLLFGILIILLSTWQAFVVPNQNEEIEFNHNQEVQEEMADLRSTAVSLPERATPQSASVNLGVRYPARVIFVNPGPASGSLRTVGTANESHEIVIENASAIDQGDDISVDDFWDGSEQTYNTGALEYRPGYNLYQNAPRTIYEHSVLFNEFEGEDATLPITDQAIIDNDRITLVALNGSLSENRVGRASVDFKPVSTRTRTVDVTDDEESGNITIHLPTRLSVEEWQSLVSDDEAVTITESDRFDSGIELEFDSGKYELQLAKVGVGTKVTETDQAYLNGVDGNDAILSDDQSQALVVEVRDEFNNPKRGVTVSASTGDGTLTDSTRETRSNGQATFEYDPDPVGTPKETRTHRINFSISYIPDSVVDHNFGTPGNITMTVDVESSETPTAGTGQRAFDTNWSVDENPRGGDTIDGQPGIEECDTGECIYNQTLALEQGGGAELILPMYTTPEVDGADVEFAVSDTDIATVKPLDRQITDGTANTTLSPDEDAEGETVTVFTWSGGSGDRVDILLENVTQDSGVGAVPSGPLAYADADDDLQYDSGETTYTESELYSFDKNVNLVIPSDVGGGEISNSKISIAADKITTRVDITTNSNNVILNANDNGPIDVTGSTIESASTVQLEGATQATLDDAAITAEETITVAGSDISATNADITTNNNNVKVDATAGPIEASGIQVDSSSDVELIANGDIYIDDSATQEAKITASGAATADFDKGSRTFYIEGVEITDDNDTLNYSPNGVTVDGSPESGSVS